jgi:hypothetical protein
MPWRKTKRILRQETKTLLWAKAQTGLILEKAITSS